MAIAPNGTSDGTPLPVINYCDPNGPMPTVRFTDPQGLVITKIECGQPYNFEVPGCTSVWLNMTRNGVVTYDGRFDVPLQNFSAACDTDVGQYVARVYNLDNGSLIGNASLEITAASSGITVGGFAIPTWGLVAAGALLLISFGKKKTT